MNINERNENNIQRLNQIFVAIMRYQADNLDVVDDEIQNFREVIDNRIDQLIEQQQQFQEPPQQEPPQQEPPQQQPPHEQPPHEQPHRHPWHEENYSDGESDIDDDVDADWWELQQQLQNHHPRVDDDRIGNEDGDLWEMVTVADLPVQVNEVSSTTPD